MTADNPPQSRFPLVTTAAWLLVAGGLMIVAARLVLPMVGLPGQWLLAAWAVVTCVGFGLLGLVPIVVLDRRMPGGAAYGFMASMLLRLGGCGAVVFIAQAQGAPRAFGYWVAACYVVLLAVEVALVGRYVKAASAPLQATPGPARNSEIDA